MVDYFFKLFLEKGISVEFQSKGSLKNYSLSLSLSSKSSSIFVHRNGTLRIASINNDHIGYSMSL